jgi:hypothetical protein
MVPSHSSKAETIFGPNEECPEKEVSEVRNQIADKITSCKPDGTRLNTPKLHACDKTETGKRDE